MSLIQFIATLNSSRAVVTPPVTPTTDFFISNSGSGTGEGTQTDPFTAQQFMTLVVAGLPGIPTNATIKFNRGEVFQIGELDLPDNILNDLKFDAYGTGDDPVFTGSEDISGETWTDEGGGIYSTPMVTEPNWIFIDGECAKLTQTNRFTILSRSSDTTITIAHANVSGYSDIVGSYLVMKQNQFWNSRRVTVTAYNGAGEITIDGAIPVTANHIDLVLYNKQEYFSAQDDEWCWEDGTLYVKASANPSTKNIRASLHDHSIKTVNKLTVRNIEFQEYYKYGVWSIGGTIDVASCYFHDMRGSAIQARNANGTTLLENVNIVSNTFDRMGHMAIELEALQNSTVSLNTVNGAGMQRNYSWQIDAYSDGSVHATGCGIFMDAPRPATGLTIMGTGNTFLNNTISDCAYDGIGTIVGTAHEIAYNKVSNFCQRFTDGGGIYTFNYRQSGLPGENHNIHHNIVWDDNGSSSAAGIYIDNRTLSANVHHNVIYECARGLVLNPDTMAHTVEDNIFFNNTNAIVWRTGLTAVTNLYDENINNICNSNYFGMLSGQKAMVFEINSGSYPTWNPFDECDDNVYVKNTVPNPNAIADSENDGTDLTLAQLQSAFGMDASSVKRSYTPSLFINDTGETSNEDAESNFKDLDGNVLTTFTIPAYYGRLVAEYNRSIQLVAASSQYLNAGTNTDFSALTNSSIFSLSLWFKMASIPGAFSSLFENRNGSARGISIAINTSGGIAIQLISTTTTNQLQIIDNTVNYADDRWHHIALYKPATPSGTLAFLDNVQKGPTANNLTATIASAENVNLGRRPNGTLHADVILSHVHFWNSNQFSNHASIYAGGRRKITFPVHPLHSWLVDASDLNDTGSAANLDLTAVNSPTVVTVD